MAVKLQAAGGRRGRRFRPMAEINVTPLVDVMLVLLIIFMIAAPLLTVGVPVELPNTDAQALSDNEEPLTITIRADGQVFLEDSEIDLEALTPRLEAIAANGYDQRIYLRGDQAANYGSVMEVMAHVQAAGFTNLGMVTDPLPR